MKKYMQIQSFSLALPKDCLVYNTSNNLIKEVHCEKRNKFQLAVKSFLKPIKKLFSLKNNKETI
jgi:hypothetical protein